MEHESVTKTSSSTAVSPGGRVGSAVDGAAPRDEASQEASDARKRRRRPRRRPKTGEQTVGTGTEGLVVAHEEWDPDRADIPPEEGKTRFQDLDLPSEILHAVSDMGFRYCTPIQAEILPRALLGDDTAGRAQTGTGKTAVFLIAALAHMLRKPITGERRNGCPRALILAPTRELVLQIERDARELSRYTPFHVLALFGGMDYEKQKRMLTDETADIIAATPGRLLDFQRRGDLDLSKIEILVIDEADRMLDMGFIPDVQKIIYATPPKSRRKTMLFSATLTSQITRYASQWMNDAFTAEITPDQVAVDTIDQQVYITTNSEKFALLYNLITREELDRVIVFANRRDQTRDLTEKLQSYSISAALLSGEVDQRKRIKTLEDFRAGKIRVLVATDVAARGLHIDGVSHVVNYHLPLDPEDYVHRIGRTGRAGASGISVSFASEDDSFQLPVIEKFLGRELPCIHPDDDWIELPEGLKPIKIPRAPRPESSRGPRPGGSRSGSSSGSGRSSSSSGSSSGSRTGGRSRSGPPRRSPSGGTTAR